MSDADGAIQDGRGNTQELLGISLHGLIGSSLLQLVSEPDLESLRDLLNSKLAYTEAVLKYRTHGKWEESYYTAANKVGVDQPFWILLRQVPAEEGGGIMLPPEVAEEHLISSEELSQQAQHHSQASFIDVEGMKQPGLTREHGEERLRNAYRSIVQTIVDDGKNKVSRVTEERYAVLHNGNYEEARVTCSLERSFDQSKIEHLSVSSQSLDIPTDDEKIVEFLDEVLTDFEYNGIDVISGYSPPGPDSSHMEDEPDAEGWVKVNLEHKAFREKL
ncbi:hypothetical protein [Kiloniella sp.]|uniref:hypothetical protein n=1 Tax=Kiloniella sp. TaxID=1938587 RepID=UPI003B0207FB